MLLICCLHSASTASGDLAEKVINILNEHCTQCHGKELAESNLRLDEERFARKTSQQGIPILSTRLEKSLLLGRISESDKDERMPPPEEDPLTEEEIALISSWLAKGSPWPQTGDWYDLKASESLTDKIRHRSLMIWNHASWFPVLILSALGALAVWHFRSGNRDYRVHLIAILILSQITWFTWHRLSVQDINRRYQGKLEGTRSLTLELLKDQSNANRFRKGNEPPVPFRPMHPKRLSGIYYRGNDERSSQLFNGGFYQTATLHLSLIDQKGKKITYGDHVAGKELFVELIVKKSPGSSPRLFSDRIRTNAFLSTDWMELDTTKARTTNHWFFSSSRVNTDWIAKVPLPVINDDQPAEGLIYSYLAKSAHPQIVNPGLHYGIRYEIRTENGKITQASELWLNSLTVFETVYYPPEGKIPVNEWIDFRPMPLIQGEASDDNILLGADDYQQLNPN